MAQWRNHNLSKSRQNECGLTIIEVLVIAPLIILLIGTIVGSLSILTGQGLEQRESSVVVYQAQAALQDIEANALDARTFLTTTGAVSSPQGKNDSTTAFTNTTTDEPDTLIFQAQATTKARNNASRQFVFYNTKKSDNSAGSCTDDGKRDNNEFLLTYVYFVKDNTLWKRTLWGPNSSTVCGGAAAIWQRPSCALANIGSGACEVEDERILNDVSELTLAYYTLPTDSTELSAAAASSASTAQATVEVDRLIAGRQVVYSAGLRVKSNYRP